MRPIPESKLEAAVLATSELKEAPGAPIHMGNPGQYFPYFIPCGLYYQLKNKNKSDGGEAMGSVRTKNTCPTILLSFDYFSGYKPQLEEKKKKKR